MPELPDVVVYSEALEKRILGQRLEGVRIARRFLLRTVDPPLESADRVLSRLLREDWPKTPEKLGPLTYRRAVTY